MLRKSKGIWTLALICCSMLIAIDAVSNEELSVLSDFGFWKSEANSVSNPCNWTGITCDSRNNISSIDRNSESLSGSIPDSIGNLSSLTTLILYFNSLNGPIPSSISKCTLLQTLRLGSNSLNGSIISEIGELTNLITLELDKNLLSGQIPPSLGNLIHLQDLILAGNSLTGSIPAELGNLKNLTRLWLHANKLDGNVPASLVNLSSMQNLTLSNNAFVGNISFLEGMPLLAQLWLRRNNFSGPIPNVSFPNLDDLDLGFNQLTGRIPAGMAAANLKQFFVGHNRLTGSIPTNFSGLTELGRFDVSHNSLTGSTISPPNTTEVDFSFNYFDGQNLQLNCNASGVSESSLGPCYPSTTGNNELAYGINAGGEQISSGNRTFQSDADPGKKKTGLFQVSGTWFLEISGLNGGILTSSTVQGIYSSARWSSSYLAYHGTQLKTGRYNITLYFAEIATTYINWRVFDVFVQGNLVVKDLDVLARVGKESAYQVAVEEDVKNGTLSIELKSNWYNYYDTQISGPMISAIYVSPLFSTTVSDGKTKTRSHLGTYIGATLGGSIALLLLIGLIVCWARRRKTDLYGNFADTTDYNNTTTAQFSKIGPTVYTYKQLSDATGGFNEKLMLGKGGFGEVYKGTLPDGSVVAVKNLTKKTRKNAETFKKEIAILSMLQHRNLVGIKGYCLDSDVSLLVCDYAENGSLEKFLFKGPVLNWEARRKIAIDSASGLQYLHEDSRYQVIHCDVKPANILLDKDMNACIADFGLAKLYKERVSQVTATKIAGTIGYIAPEYAAYNELSEKIDVYSFGVVLLELLSGKRGISTKSKSSSESSKSWIVSEAHEIAYLEPPSNLLRLMDDKLEGKFNKEEALEMSTIAVLCTQECPDDRPKMRDVWLMLSKKIPIPPLLQEGKSLTCSFVGTSGEDISSSHEPLTLNC